MDRLFRLSGAKPYQPEVDEWLSGVPHELYSIAKYWFGQMRKCGDDVRELIHDGCPVACVDDAAFAYVNVFSAHVNVGFFTGAMLTDPSNMLEGTGKRMRHVKIKPGQELNAQALDELVRQSYLYVRNALRQ